MTTLDPALPDAEALVSQFLRAQPELEAAIGNRVYTALPGHPTWPLIRLTLVAGSPVVSRPLVVDRPRIQLEAYGGSKKDARDLIDLARRLIAARIEGVHAGLGVVSGYVFGNQSYLPDDSYSPTRPRYIADVELITKPDFNSGS